MQLAPHAEVVAAAAVLLAAVARAAGAVTTSGAAAGVVVGSGVAAGFGISGFALLAAFFVAGSLLTRLGWKVKQARGTAEATGGARDWRRVVGKGGVAAGLGAAAALGCGQPFAFVGAIAAALADTAGTEVGTLASGEPLLLPSFRRVPHGTAGAVSAAGLVAALLAAKFIVLGGFAFESWFGGGLPVWQRDILVGLVMAGFVASVAELLVVGLAPVVKRVPGWVRNVFTTGVGALLGWLLTGGSRVTKARAVVELARPFTLLAPALGMLAFGLASLGHGSHELGGRFEIDETAALRIGTGAAMAAFLNVASNAVNQVYDIEIDRMNKPERPLPSGRLTVGEAKLVTALAYAVAIGLAAALGTTMLGIVAFTAFLTYAYSGPPFRTKRHWLLANLTIAAPRGFLLPVAGWVAAMRSDVRLSELPPDLWIVAGASGVFILGAASTKDFADMEGDRAGGCITLPLRFGVVAGSRMVAPFLFAPWIALAAATAAHALAGNAFVLFWGSALCGAIGLRAAWLLVRDPAALTSKSTHPAWVLMYLLMLATQAVAAFGYALPPELAQGWAP